MAHIDIFNGDADGICALTQLRLAEPLESRLVTGVKRDISLLGKASVEAGDKVTVLDISLDKNREALIKALDVGAECLYIDHHFAGEPIPNGVNLKGKFIYYVGPVDPVRDEVIGPAGPTTATRMDKFTDQLLEETGLLGMIGKAERGPTGIEAIKKHRSVYLIAVGGAAYLVSKAIRQSRIVAFEELGMEAIHEFVVEDMPVTVAVSTDGESAHKTGPRHWQQKIGKIPVVTS